MNKTQLVHIESKRIREKLDGMTKEQLLQQLLHCKIANFDLTEASNEKDVYINSLEAELISYRKGVDSKIIEGINRLKL